VENTSPNLEQKGSQLGQLCSPSGVAIDSYGNYVIAEWNNNRISKFAPNGNHICSFGVEGKQNKFFKPLSVSIDGLGNILIADSKSLQVYDKWQNYVLQINLGGCVGTAVFKNGDFIVVHPDSRKLLAIGSD